MCFHNGGGQNDQDGDAQSATWTEMLDTESAAKNAGFT